MMAQAGELVFYLTITAAIVAVSGGRRMLSQGRVAYLAFGLTVALSIAQVVRNPSVTYPLPSWTMYQSPLPPQTYQEFEIEDVDGRVLKADRLDALSWLPGPLRGYSTPSPMTMKIDQLRPRCRCVAGDPVLDETLASLTGMLRDLGGPIVIRVSIIRHTVTLRSAASTPKVLYRWTAGDKRPAP